MSVKGSNVEGSNSALRECIGVLLVHLEDFVAKAPPGPKKQSIPPGSVSWWHTYLSAGGLGFEELRIGLPISVPLQAVIVSTKPPRYTVQVKCGSHSTKSLSTPTFVMLLSILINYICMGALLIGKNFSLPQLLCTLIEACY